MHTQRWHRVAKSEAETRGRLTHAITVWPLLSHPTHTWQGV